MKKLLLLVAIASISAECSAQKATVLLNNFDANNAVSYYGLGGPAPPTVSVELLGGPSATQLQPVTIAGTTQSVIPISSFPGFFDGGVGVVPGVAAGATATFQLTGFFGTNPLHPAQNVTPTWTQATGSWDDTAIPPQPPTGPVLQAPSLFVLVLPEPSTIVLGMLGLGAMFLCRRN